MHFVTRFDITGAFKNFIWVNIEVDRFVESIYEVRLRLGKVFDLKRSWIDQSIFFTIANIGIVKKDMALMLA